MKNKILSFSSIMLILCVIGLFGCGSQSILKLNHRLGVSEDYLTQNQEMIYEDVELVIEIAETDWSPINDDAISGVVSEITNKYPDLLNEQWEYMIHFFDEQKTVGIVQFRYVINGEIVTNKLITCNYENGKINSIAYSNISKTVDEISVAERVSSFRSKYTQEKKKLKDDEEFIKETTIYTYNYNQEKLIYEYNLFYYKGQHELRIIDNDTVSEYFIDLDGNAVE